MTDGTQINPATEARKYIEVFRTHTLPGAQYVDLTGGRRIYFDNMTDEEAIGVAKGLAQMEAIAALSTMKKSGANS